MTRPASSVSTSISRPTGRLSEVNSDVPGGLNEASGFPPLIAPPYPWAQPLEDPAASYVTRLARPARPHGTVALIHATAYSDDSR